MTEIANHSETHSKRHIDSLNKEKRKTEEWIDENDITHQYDGHFVTEIEERKTKILEEQQRIMRYEGNIESYKEQLKKVQEDIAALGVDSKATDNRVKKKVKEIEEIRDVILTAQNSRDHYDRQRKKYASNLKEYQKQRDEIEQALKTFTAKAIEKVPIRPKEIPADEEKERQRIASIQLESASNATLLRDATQIEEKYKMITEVLSLCYFLVKITQF